MLKRPWLLFILFATACAVYFTALDGAFVYDDEFLIQKNQLLDQPRLWSSFFHTSSTYGAGGQDSFYRPLQLLSYALAYQIDGLNPVVFHLLNVLLHALNAVLLFILLERLFHHRMFSFMTALAWAVHPVHVEAIAYASGTADPLYVFFSLLSLICVLKIGVRAQIMAILLFLCALLSKESAVFVSGLVFLCMWVDSGRLKVALLRALPFVLLAGFYTSLRGTVLNLADSFQFYSETNPYTESILIRLWTAFATLTDYLSLMIWPNPLSIDQSYPAFGDPWHGKVVVGLAITIASVMLMAWSWRKKHHIFFFGAAWFWCAHLLHTGVFIPLNSLFLEHWLYLPSMGLMMLLTVGISAILKDRLWIAMAVPIAAWGAITVNQNNVWHDALTLYPHILKHSPNIARVHNNLAMAYSERGDAELAKKHYLRAIAISDDYPQVHHNLALVYLSQGDASTALREFERAVKMQPNFFHSYPYMAKCYELLGQSEKAKESLRLFEQYRPKFE